MNDLRDASVWTDGEDGVLITAFHRGVSISTLSKRHLRSKRVIRERLINLGWINEANSDSAELRLIDDDAEFMKAAQADTWRNPTPPHEHDHDELPFSYDSCDARISSGLEWSPDDDRPDAFWFIDDEDWPARDSDYAGWGPTDNDEPTDWY